MGLLLSVLVTCVGVLEVIACYTHFRIGIAYNECKSNIRDIAKYYAVELRKHELRFETPPPDHDRGECSTSTVRVQEKSGHGLHSDALIPGQNLQSDAVIPGRGLQSNSHPAIVEPTLSVSATPNEDSPNLAANLKVPRNSFCGLDSPTLQQLTSDVNISQVIASALQDHENDEQFWTRKSPSPLPEKTNLDVVEKDFWKNRAPSPSQPNEESDTGLVYTPRLRKPPLSPILKPTTSVPNNIHTFVADSDTIYTDVTSTSERPDLQKFPSLTDLEVQQILSVTDEPEFIPRQPSPYPDVLFGLAENQEPKFDEDFLRSLDGVKSPKCDDKRRNFRKKRNSSSTSSRASRDETRSLPSLDEVDGEQSKRSSIYQQQSVRSDITPLLEETPLQCPTDLREINENLFRTESVLSEKYDVIQSPEPPLTASESQGPVIVTKHEEPTYQASTQDRKDIKSETGKSGTEVSFTEKVKDLEISVQLMVTVKGASSGDKMEYSTNISRDASKQNSVSPKPIEENSTTTTTEESGKFGHVTTSLTVGGSSCPPKSQEKTNEQRTDTTDNKVLSIPSASTNGFDKEENQNLKDLQISSQSLICSERASVQHSQNEALKLYESFNELPEVEKNKFLRFIGRSKIIEETEATSGKKKKQLKEEEKMITAEIPTSRQEDCASAAREKPFVEQVERTETESTKDVLTKNENIIPDQTKIDKKINEVSSDDNKHKRNETLSTLTNDQQKMDSSESSSETPTTAIENFMRRASQTSFEEASLSQSEAMLKRRLSNTEISPQQASQAFWVK